jgi:hypothetical protein
MDARHAQADPAGFSSDQSLLATLIEFSARHMHASGTDPNELSVAPRRRLTRRKAYGRVQ